MRRRREICRQRLFKVIWENLQHVSELGSLVQVREGVERVLDDWVEARAREKGLTRVFAQVEHPQLELGSILADMAREQALQLQLERRLLEAEARQLQQELLAAIEDEAAQVGGDPPSASLRRIPPAASSSSRSSRGTTTWWS